MSDFPYIPAPNVAAPVTVDRIDDTVEIITALLVDLHKYRVTWNGRDVTDDVVNQIHDANGALIGFLDGSYILED